MFLSPCVLQNIALLKCLDLVLNLLVLLFILPLIKDGSTGSPFSGLAALKNGTETNSGPKEATVVNSDLNVLCFITQDVERSLGVWLILVMLILFLCSRFVGNLYL